MYIYMDFYSTTQTRVYGLRTYIKKSDSLFSEKTLLTLSSRQLQLVPAVLYVVHVYLDIFKFQH